CDESFFGGLRQPFDGALERCGRAFEIALLSFEILQPRVLLAVTFARRGIDVPFTQNPGFELLHFLRIFRALLRRNAGKLYTWFVERCEKLDAEFGFDTFLEALLLEGKLLQFERSAAYLAAGAI